MFVFSMLMNVVLILMAVFLMIDEGSLNTEELLIYSILIVTPIVNIITLFSGGKNNNWFTLYFKRKSMEEKMKIEKMSDKSSG
jgi:hypothetical protein